MRLFRYRDRDGAVQFGSTTHRDDADVYRLDLRDVPADDIRAAHHWMHLDVWEPTQDLPGSPIDDRLEDLELLAPVDAPANILCVGLNYREHSEEFLGRKHEAMEHPIIFAKSPSCVVGPGATIDLHGQLTREVDYEAELAVVIGRQGSDIAAVDAWKHILGLTALNDVTARDLQRRHQQWTLGKSLDTFCPIGPWIVTLDEFELPLELGIRCLVDGEERQRSNTRQLIFDIPTLVSIVSQGRTLEVGDVIATGTPSGVGMAMDPPAFLQPGQSVSVEIEGIGALSNTCAEQL